MSTMWLHQATPRVFGSTATGSKSTGPKTTYECLEDLADSCRGLRVSDSHYTRATFLTEQHKQQLEEDYAIGEELGEGATATVYRALHLSTEQPVAVKAIRKSLVQDRQILENEITIQKATDHPNILRLLETYEDEEHLHLVTELCEGGDLRTQLTATADEFSALKMSEKDALQLFQQVVSSVLYLHQKGIVHRDLKPGNFLCAASAAAPTKPEASRRLILKLADFGVSATCGIRHRLTRRVGTDGFMAPEVLRCSPYDQKADIFSIGCILHMMLTGHPPKWQEETGEYKLNKLRFRFLSEEMRSLLQWLLQPLPEDRPSAEQVAQLPLLQSSRVQLRETSARLDTHLLDRMYAYSHFPLLKKAALVAMVCRADSDEDFLPCIEKFMCIGSINCSAIDVEDIYDSLLDELLADAERSVASVFQTGGSRRRRRRDGSTALTAASAPACCGTGAPPARRSRRSSSRRGISAERFYEELRADLETLIYGIDTAGTIYYSEWLASTVGHQWYTDPQRIASTFRLFDCDQDGLISASDLRQALPGVSEKLCVHKVLEQSQLSESSCISEVNFARLISTQNHSAFTLRCVAAGIADPLGAADTAAP